jgi:hypothetical protein
MESARGQVSEIRANAAGLSAQNLLLDPNRNFIAVLAEAHSSSLRREVG